MMNSIDTIKNLEFIRRKLPRIAEKGLQEEIAKVAVIRKFSSGEVTLDYNNYVKWVPIVLEGSLRVVRENEDGQEIFLYYLQVGDTCASSFTCCMTHKRSVIKTIAEDDTTLLCIPIKYLDTWMSKYQSWKNFILLSYEDRMNNLIETIDTIAFLKMDERLILYLEEKAKINKSKTITTTHQEIAFELHASREAVSRLLKQLEKSGRLELGRNRITML